MVWIFHPKVSKLAKRYYNEARVHDIVETFLYNGDFFDGVLCLNILHHCRRFWTNIYNIITRVLKKKGHLWIIETDASNLLERIGHSSKSFFRIAASPNEQAIYLSDLKNTLQKYPFKYNIGKIRMKGRQRKMDIFPLWLRIFRAPFILFLSWRTRKMPNKILVTAIKTQNKGA